MMEDFIWQRSVERSKNCKGRPPTPSSTFAHRVAMDGSSSHSTSYFGFVCLRQRGALHLANYDAGDWAFVFGGIFAVNSALHFYFILAFS